MGETQTIKITFTDREIWEFGTNRGFPENPEISLVRSGAWEHFAESLAGAREEEVPVPENNSEEPEPTEKVEIPETPEEIEKEEPLETQEIEEFLDSFGPAEPVFPDVIETYLTENPQLRPIIEHIAASVMYPQNVFNFFADIGGNELRMRGAQPIQGGPDTAFATLIRVGREGNFLGLESPDTIYDLMEELAGVKGEDPGESYLFEPLTQFVFLAVADVIRENRIEGGRFTPSSLMNALDLSRETNFKHFSAPIAEIIGRPLLSTLSLEEMTQLVEDLTTQGVFIREKAGDRMVYTFASGFRILPEMFSCSENRFALFRYDANGKGDLLYVISEGNLSWAFIVKDKSGRIERMNKDSLAKVLAEIFPRSLFCTSCGTPLHSGARFCEECGAKAE